MDCRHTSTYRQIRYHNGISISRRNSQTVKGFTLLEVLIAVAIILGGILAVAMSWSGNFNRVRKTALYNNVSLLLERKAAEVEALYKNKTLEEIPDEDGGDFGKDFPQYRWEVKAQDFEFPDLSSVLISRDEGADDLLLMVIQQTQEFISKSVKEVTISVFAKTPTREVEYSVTTYFVDYTQEFNLGIGTGGQTRGGGN